MSVERCVANPRRNDRVPKALIVPPTKPGWKEARAGIVSDAVMQEAAAFAEQNDAAYNALQDDGVSMTVAGWEN